MELAVRDLVPKAHVHLIHVHAYQRAQYDVHVHVDTADDESPKVLRQTFSFVQSTPEEIGLPALPLPPRGSGRIPGHRRVDLTHAVHVRWRHSSARKDKVFISIG